MSRWNWGCGCRMTVYVPRGYSHREINVECGSTAYDGGVNQCESCADDPRMKPPPPREMEDWGDED